ncbi:MAG: carboxymuconolactone decarboxylase family protein [Sediminicola sp.]
MENRINVFEIAPKAIGTLYGISNYLKRATIERQLLELVDFRVSQINGCAYCLDMHSKELRNMGETEQRIYGLSAWRDAPYYSEREKAALEWAEAVTRAKVKDEIYELAKTEFSDGELVDLTLAITAINTWNRINLAFPQTPGTYKVGQFG